MSKKQLIPQLTPIARVLRTAATVLTGSAMAWPMVVPANPTGSQVVNGQAQITNPAAGGLVINQQSNAAIINWQSFSVGDGEYVVFNQPSVSAATLNRVVGNLPSEILGNLTANGRVFVINSNGVMFGANSRVDVGALITSTGNISNEDFLSGDLKFSGNSTASIVNRGQISAANGGFGFLSADKVTNSGTIKAPGGNVLLAAGSQLSLQLDPEGLISYSVDAAAASATAGVENFGDIIANGGSVVMAANVARGLIGTAINNTGRVSARGIEQRGGEIYLVAEGGSIEQRGVLDASSANGDGGRISIRSDRNIALAGGSRTDASGVDGGEAIAIAGEALFYETGAEMSVAGRGNGEGGFAELSGRTVQIRDTVDLGNGAHLLIDPVDLRVDDAGYGGNIDYSTLFTMLQLGDVTIEAENSIVFSDYQSNFFSTSYGGALVVNAGVVPAGCALSLCDPGVTAPAHAPGIFFDGTDDTFSIYGGIQLTSTVADSQIVSLANLSSGQGGGIAITAPGLIDLKDVSAQYGGDIEIISSGGAISTGNLNLTGNLFLTADADITLAFLSTPSLSLTSVFIDAGGALLGLNGAPINASGTVDIESAAGDLSFASINVGPSARIAANGGTLSVGDVYAYDYSAPASISLAAAGDLVAGDLSVSSYGDDASIVASADGSVGTGNLSVYAGASGGDVTGSASITASADGATTGTTLQTGAISVSFGLSPSTGAGVVSLSNAGGEIVAGQIEVGADETGSNITRTVDISALGDIYGEYVEPEVVLLSVDRKDIDGVNSNGLDIDLGTSTGNATVSVVSAQGSIRTRYLTAGPSTGTTSGITLTATAGSITADDDSFMSGGAIGVSAANIDLSGASLDIGSGYAGFGEDQAFVALDVNDPAGSDVTLGESIPLLASGANPQPNASFKSPNQILLGNLDVEGSYAFVKAPGVTANNVSGGYDEFEAPLPLQVFNFRPYDDGGNLVFPNAIGGDLRNNVLSYLLGGTDYAGTISFPAPLTVVDCTDCVVGGGKDLGNANYVLYTSGSIVNQAGTVVTSTGLINPSDENLPSTSGQFIVLKKATPPPVATPTPTPVVTPTPTPAVTPTPTPVVTPTPTPAVTPTPTPVATPTPTPVITPTPTPVVTPTPTPVITPTPTPVVTPTPTPVVTPTPTPMADMTEILTALAEAPKTDDPFLKPTPVPKPGQGEIQRRDTSYQIGEFSCDATGVQ